MDKILLSSLPNLKDAQQAILRKGNVNTISDLVLTPPQDLAKRCRVSSSEISRLIQNICQSQGRLQSTFQSLEDVVEDDERAFTIGDVFLDDALGGGLRTGMVWEIVGESAAGKTQFALQSSLYAQLPEAQGGLGGSVCYLTTKTILQTSRLLQIKQARDLSDASLEDVHTLSAPTVHILLNILENHVPTFIETVAKTPSRKPVKLLIIDALAELFHLVAKTSTASLVERSQQLTRVSALLHRFADRYKIAVIVLNEVADVFDNYAVDYEKSENGILLYSEQARWFNRGHSVYGENQKEAALGLVWANQVNARVMLSRTGRRRYVDEDAEGEEGEKRHKREGENDDKPSPRNPAPEQEPTLIRRLTVVFNSAGLPTSCDYIVTSAGIRGLPSETKPPQARVHEWAQSQQTPDPRSSDALPEPSIQPPAQPPAPAAPSQTVIPSSQEEEYEDQLWADEEFFDNVDWDNLEQTLLRSQDATD
ncbi:hypothetical protein D9756_001880 [Leucocoprinus leucothites]|uniref:RecA family profile 1 domain-containing protein n=1 Tax=Leucocoprinus leucothites TaxID=201217 RepID=A0A8H5G4X9_9AGAR|nr:hypothetical protein D9756_001880 [Leucoagaricus leucothites]